MKTDGFFHFWFTTLMSELSNIGIYMSVNYEVGQERESKPCLCSYLPYPC
jgi:hypothetical protein